MPNGRADGNEKSLERIFPGMEVRTVGCVQLIHALISISTGNSSYSYSSTGNSSMAVIIDDREDVWKGR